MGLLFNDDRTRVEEFAGTGESPNLRRRAEALLLLDDGLRTSEVAQRVGLSAGRVRYWRRQYQRVGIAVFPVPAGGDKDVLEGSQESTDYPSSSRRADHRRGLALTLFAGTQAVHRLPDSSRRLLEAAALLQELTEKQADDRTDRAAHLFIFSHPSAELNEEEQAVVERILEIQRSKVKQQTLVDLQNASTPTDREAYILASLLRMACGLDESNSQSTWIEDITSTPKKLLIEVNGLQASQDARAAQKRAKLWSVLFGQAVTVRLSSQEVLKKREEALETLMSKKNPGVSPDDPLAEAGRKVLGFHFAAMLRHEDGTREGIDIEELHDMRVATRRMRAAFEVFADAFQPKVLKTHLKGLRLTGRALGRVRDMDVFIEKARRYQDSLEGDQRSGLVPLLEAWQTEREEDRSEMLKHLNSQEYQDFKRSFLIFLTKPGAGVKETSEISPNLVRHLLPVLVYTRLAAVRAYGPILDSASIEQLHALRIEFKKLRYTLEYFSEVLGRGAKEIIEQIKSLQDHLGDLNDADVACQMLRDFLDEWEARQMVIPIEERQNPEPIVSYLAFRHAERHHLMVTFKDIWQGFDQPDTWLKISQMISTL